MPPPRAGPDSIAPGARRWTPAAALARGVEVLRTEGARSLAFRALGETVYRRLVLFELDLLPVGPPAGSSELEFGWLDEGGLGAYERLRAGRGSEARRRLALGHRCFATWLGGELVAARWVATESSRIEYLGVTLDLRDGEAYQYDTFTSPNHRRRGLSYASHTRLVDELRREGRKTLLRAVLPENGPAVRDAARAGFRRAGRIGYLRLGRWRRELVPRR